jgi:CubicO group peptidase (beta-lactamase class C family)
MLVLAVMLAAGQGSVGAAPVDADVEFEAIDRFVEAQMARHRIPGLALAITRGDEILHLRGFGSAGDGRAMTPETPLYIGSVSKPITALAVMQLAEQGLIDLDAPVQTYLPWFQVADPVSSRQITVRHLLYQTSGLSEAGYWPELPDDASLKEAVEALQRAKPVDPPGTEFHYFNPHYTTLGLIVETMSGQSYADYVQTHIFEPLKMTRSTAEPARARQMTVAQGYGVLFGLPLARQQSMHTYEVPSGGIVSTAQDMAHFVIAQNSGGAYAGACMLPAAAIEEMHRPGIGSPVAGYGMGWMVEEQEGVAIRWHGGSLENYRAFAYLLPDQDYGLVVLINQNGFLPMLLAFSEIPAGIVRYLVGTEPSNSVAMRTVYGLITAVFLAVVALEIFWWWKRFPRWRRQVPVRFRVGLLLDIGSMFLLPVVLFLGLPPLLLTLLGRRMVWEEAFAMAPAVMILVWFLIVAGLVRGVVKLGVVFLNSRVEDK